MYIDTFSAVLTNAGLCPETIVTDGCIHRCGTVGKERGKDGAYVLYPDPPISGHYWNYRTGEDASWSEATGRSFSPEERTRVQSIQVVRRKRENAIAASAAIRAQRILATSQLPPPDHPYFVKKGISVVGGIRYLKDGRLVLPLGDAANKVQSLQFITPDGEKRFLSGGTVRGGSFLIPGDDTILYIAEGYATGASIHAASGHAVLIAFCCSNLCPVAAIARSHFPDSRIVLCADNDHETFARRGKNPGLDHATIAARAIHGRLALPVFKTPAGKSDFNDLATSEGLEAVQACLEAAAEPIFLEAAGGPPTTARHPLVALSASAFLSYTFCKREYLLDPILPTQGLALIYAPRGLGKTFLALSIACGVALGMPALRWKVAQPRKVLFVDGEMQGWMMQERLQGILQGFGDILPETLRVVTPDCQPDFIPNLGTPEGQASLEPLLDGVELVILDNLATLCRVGKENESESWLPIQDWLLSLRRRGIAVIVIHHANKSGGQRGTSSREDVMDTVIALRPPKEHTAQDGATFEVHIEKSRGVAGDALEPFMATLVAEGGTFRWTTQDINADRDSVFALKEQGLSVRTIADQTGLSKSAVQRIIASREWPAAPTESSRKIPGRGVPASQS